MARHAVANLGVAIRQIRPATFELLPRSVSRPVTGCYPLDWRMHAQRADGPASIVLSRAPSGDRYRNPVAIAFRIIADHQKLALAPSREVSDSLTAHAEALIDLQNHDGRWTYPIPVARYGVPEGWVSGMAQGLGASALIRCVDFMDGRRVEDAVGKAMIAALLPISEGGTADYDASGAPFLEECPGGSIAANPFILNGAVFGTVGLWEAAQFLQDPRLSVAASSAIGRLRSLLPRWDKGWWSRYDLANDEVATPDYHALHVTLMDLMARVDPAPEWSTMGSKWRHDAGSVSKRFRALSDRGWGVLRGRLI